jgi:glycosyltransferase involved in cell wall biosynthesis
MATRNRRNFFRVALRCFQRQTRPDVELVVIDDGEESVADLCKGLSNVCYVRVARPTLLGAKLNMGIEASRGTLLQKLDDDDYYQPEFLATAASHLPEEGDRIVAWCCFRILLAGEEQIRDSGHGWRAGGTLCFPRGLGEKHPFRPLPRSVDRWFVEDSGSPLVRVCAPEQYLLVRHGRNTWTSMQGGMDADTYLRKFPPCADLAAAVDAQALKFYRKLPPC